MRFNLRYGFLPLLVLLSALLMAVAADVVAAEQRAWLGVYLRDYEKRSDADVTNFGAVVEQIVENGPAEKGGLKEGDIIVKLDNKTIRDADDVTQDLKKKKSGDTIRLDVVRDKKNVSLEVKLGEKPETKMTFAPRKNRVLINLNSPYLGVEMEDLNPDLAEYFQVKAEEGVLVTRVMEDSPAEKAGLKAGDVITFLNGKAITTTEDLIRAVRKADSDEEAEITYIRKGRAEKVRVELECDKKRIRIFGEADDDAGAMYFELPDKTLTIELEGLTKDLKAEMLRLKKELPNDLKLDLRLHHQENMESLKEEMQKLKQEMKELKKRLEKELQEK